MRRIAQIVSFLVFIAGVVWFARAPAYESGIAAGAALAAFVVTLVYEPKPKAKATQEQRASGGSTAIQSGRDVHYHDPNK